MRISGEIATLACGSLAMTARGGRELDDENFFHMKTVKLTNALLNYGSEAEFALVQVGGAAGNAPWHILIAIRFLAGNQKRTAKLF